MQATSNKAPLTEISTSLGIEDPANWLTLEEIGRTSSDPANLFKQIFLLN